MDQSIRDSISKMLPISEILQEYLIGNLHDIDSASDDSDGADSVKDLEYDMTNDKPDVCEIENDSSDDDEEDPDNTPQVVSDDDNESSDDENGEDTIKHVTMGDNKTNHFSSKPATPLPPPPPLPSPPESSDSKDLF